MLTLCENPQETLTKTVYENWSNAGYLKRQNSLTYLEISNLAKYYLKRCKEISADYREFDFQTLIDYKLTYYENLSLIENSLGQPEINQEQDALAELNNKLSQDYGITVTKTLKPQTELEETNKKLKQQLSELLKERDQLNQKLSIPAEPTIITKEVIKEVPIEIIKEVAIPAQLDPTATQYTQAELAEMIEYLQNHKPIKPQRPKRKITKIFTGTYNVLSLAAWLIRH